MKRVSLLLLAMLLPTAPLGAEKPAEPLNYVFAGGSSTREVETLLQRPGIDGLQIVYSWRALEPAEGQYDFSAIDRDLADAGRLDKHFWIQLQDRFFLPQARHLPDYILTEPQYGGGLARQFDNPGEGKAVGAGWAAMQWNPALRVRFQALIAALAERFDGRIEGINLPETAIDVVGDGTEAGFDCDLYFDAELENIRFARRAFQASHVVQYTNFFPCEWNNDKGYMGRMFNAAVADGFGVGGPDIIPYRRAQMKNSYPFFNRFKDDLPIVAMAVQGPTLTYTDPATGRKFTREAFVAYARDYLGVDIIFWTAESPWLRK